MLEFTNTILLLDAREESWGIGSFKEFLFLIMVSICTGTSIPLNLVVSWEIDGVVSFSLLLRLCDTGIENPRRGGVETGESEMLCFCCFFRAK